jgi:hypothetical protein
MPGLDVLHDLFLTENLFIRRSRMNTHMIEALQVHGLRLCMPDFIPFALEFLLAMKYGNF